MDWEVGIFLPEVLGSPGASPIAPRPPPQGPRVVLQQPFGHWGEEKRQGRTEKGLCSGSCVRLQPHPAVGSLAGHTPLTEARKKCYWEQFLHPC